MTELELANDSGLTVLPPARPAVPAAVAVLDAHVEMMVKAHQFATAMCGTSMVPARLRGKPDDGAAAILYGAELGLTPAQSLQRVIPIHGSPTIEARTMVALLKARGYRMKTIAQSDESVTVEGYDLAGERYESTWTIQRAIKAKYVPEKDERTGKYKTNDNGKLIGNEKYLSDPQAMLKAKAQAEVCRDMAPEVLLGIAYSREDLESEQFDDETLRRPVHVHAEPVTVEEILGDATDQVRSLRGKVKSAREMLAETVVADPQPVASEEVPKVDKERVSPELTAREKWLNRLAELLDAGGCDEVGDRLLVAAKVAHTAPLLSLDALNDKQLRTAVNQLNNWRATGELVDQVNEILDSAVIAAENTKEETE